MFKRYYLAYGSNLNLRQMKKRCKGAKPIGAMVLENHHLVYKGYQDFYGYLTIEELDGSFVPLGIFEITLFDEMELDRYEGYPNVYHKEYIEIMVERKRKKALIYVMNKEFDYHLPSPTYIKTCEKGYDFFNFDKSILNRALGDTIECRPKALKKFTKEK